MTKGCHFNQFFIKTIDWNILLGVQINTPYSATTHSYTNGDGIVLKRMWMRKELKPLRIKFIKKELGFVLHNNKEQ